MQSLIKMNIKTKMLLYILAPSIVIFIITIAYINIKNRNLALAEANKLCYETTLKNAKTIEASLLKDLAVTHTLAQAFTIFDQMEEDQWKDVFLKMIYKTFEKNTQFDEFSFSLELKYFDEDRSSDMGRYFLHFRRRGNEIPFFGMDVNLDKFSDVYLNAKNISKDMIWKPWLNKDNRFITNISSPIYKNNQFAGYVVGDFYLSRFKSVIDSIKPYDSTTAMLISNEGIIVGHKDTTVVGKPVSEYAPAFESQFNLSQIIKEGKSDIFEALDTNNNEVLVSIAPIQIGEYRNPWSLVLIIPVVQVLKEANNTQITSLIAAFIGILLLTIIIVLISKNISLPIVKTTNAMKKIAKGDIREGQNLKIKSGDELEDMSNSVRSMSATLNKMINEINKGVGQLIKSSKKSNDNAHQLNESATEQAASLEQISASMEQANANIQNTAINADETKKISEKAFHGINKISDSTISSMTSIKNIAEKITVITEIAFQTNILALNASVEAARAGKHGKGFAVVAAEVRKLAERSKDAAVEIINLTNIGVSETENTAKIIKEILPDVENTAKLIQEITNSSIEQLEGTNVVNQSIQQLNSVTQGNLGSSEQLKERSEILRIQADGLKKLIEFFQVQ